MKTNIVFLVAVLQILTVAPAFGCGGDANDKPDDVQISFSLDGDNVKIVKATTKSGGKPIYATLTDDDGWATLWTLANYAPTTASSDNSIKEATSALARKLSREIRKSTNPAAAGVANSAADLGDTIESEGFSAKARTAIYKLRNQISQAQLNPAYKNGDKKTSASDFVPQKVVNSRGCSDKYSIGSPIPQLPAGNPNPLNGLTGLRLPATQSQH